MYIVGQLKDSISGILSGVNLNNVTNLNGAIERAARTLVQKADIPEATGRQIYTVYDGVYDYAAPTTIFGGALLDFRPQGDSRTMVDFVYKKPIEMFDRTKAILPNGAMLTFEYSKGTGRVRIVSTRNRIKATIDNFTDKTDWTAGGNTGTLYDDETDYYQSPQSIRFNVSAGGSQATLARTLDSEIDLTEYEGVGVGFLAVKLPAATAITSIGVQIGNDASNYWSVSNTTGFLGAWNANEWTLIKLDLSTATTTGTVDASAIDYCKVFLNYDGTALTNVRVGGLWFSLPSSYEMIFQSAAIFMAGTTPSQTITDDNDSILLNDAAYTLFEYEGALAVLQQSGGTLSSPMAQTIKAVLHGQGNDIGLYAHYRSNNPSDAVRTVGSYYD